PEPVLVGGLTANAMEVAPGSLHTCMRASDNTVHCWGDNAVGQLGDGTTASSPTPVAVQISDAVRLEAGCHSGCVLRRDATVWCWGDAGELGSGPPTASPTPGRARVPCT